MEHRHSLLRLIDEFKVYHCVECGKCTGACPLAQVDRDFSPRLMAKEAIEKGLASEYLRDKVWVCLTCGLCTERCPLGIAFADFIRALRALYRGEDCRGHLSHGGALQGLMRIQAAPRLVQNRLDWISPGLKVAARGEILYFVGCLPYFDAFFRDLKVGATEIAVDTVKILNSLGIEPVVLPDERCCGHDLIWTGDEESFHRLRRINIESFQKAGARTIVTACAECSYVLKHLYRDASEPFPFEVMHLSEFLQAGGLRVETPHRPAAAYQDPCRLARFQGLYEAPRELLGGVVELREMPHSGRGAWCCGNSAWLHCDRYSKQMQVERLMEAKGTGAEMLVTACPKCRVHLTCAMREVNRVHDFPLEIKDISSVIAGAIEEDKKP